MGAISRTGRGYFRRSTKSVTFTGAANIGKVGTISLFDVTGEVLIDRIVPYCTDDLAGASATLALGVTGSTALFVAATTATTIDTGEFWVDTSPDANGIALPAALKDIVVTDNIIGTVATADVTGGTLRVDVYWLPLSSDGNVSPAAGPYAVFDSVGVAEDIVVSLPDISLNPSVAEAIAAAENIIAKVADPPLSVAEAVGAAEAVIVEVQAP